LTLRYWIVLILWIFYKYFVCLPPPKKKKRCKEGLSRLHWPGRLGTSHISNVLQKKKRCKEGLSGLHWPGRLGTSHISNVFLVVCLNYIHLQAKKLKNLVRERELLFGRNMRVRNISVLEGSVTVAIDAAYIRLLWQNRENTWQTISLGLSPTMHSMNKN
jgi:hypothetical protein